MNVDTARTLIRSFPALLVAVALTGCSTTSKVDWDSRIGVFTYDQAIAELGPPDKQARLSDGKTVASWITRRSGGKTGVGMGGYGAQSTMGASHDRVLRLTFGADGKLAAWSKNY